MSDLLGPPSDASACIAVSQECAQYLEEEKKSEVKGITYHKLQMIVVKKENICPKEIIVVQLEDVLKVATKLLSNITENPTPAPNPLDDVDFIVDEPGAMMWEPAEVVWEI